MFKRMILSAITLLAMAPLTATNEGLSVRLTGNSLELMAENDSLSKDEAEFLCDKLLKNPLLLLCEIKKYEHELQQLFEAVSDGKAEFDPAAMAETFQKQRALNPIFLVEECSSGECGLSRHQNSSRSFYESVVLKYLKKHKDQERINLVSFASGGMFQDLIILAKAIKLHGISNINIHLIDTKYTSYTQALSSLHGNSCLINLCTDKSSVFHAYSLSKESEKIMQQKCEMYLTVMHEQLRQFVSLVQVLSDKNIKIYIHKDAASYQTNCRSNPYFQADLLMAMDFGPNPYTYKGMLRDYYSLIYHSLKAGGVAIFADDITSPEKLNIIDRFAHKGLHTALVEVHTKKEICSEQFLHNITNQFPILFSDKSAFCKKEFDNFIAIEAKSIDNNQFVKHCFEFKGMSLAGALRLK